MTFYFEPGNLGVLQGRGFLGTMNYPINDIAAPVTSDISACVHRLGENIHVSKIIPRRTVVFGACRVLAEDPSGAEQQQRSAHNEHFLHVPPPADSSIALVVRAHNRALASKVHGGPLATTGRITASGFNSARI